jgi:hypothetical protein
MAVIRVCRTRRRWSGLGRPWAAEGLRWRCGASRGSRRLSAVVKEALRKHEIAADDSFKAELTTRLVGKSFPSLPGVV